MTIGVVEAPRGAVSGAVVGSYTENMKLGVARICLDCDEIHDQERCPVCASEASAFLTRWVKRDTPITRPRVPPSPDEPRETVERVDAYRQLATGAVRGSLMARFLRSGALLLAGVGLARWAWRLNRRRPERPNRPPVDPS